MKCLQVAAAGGAARLGLLEGARVHVLAKPHDGVATTLDLLVAVDERGLDAVSWRRAAESAGAFEEMAWADLAAGRLPSKLTVPLTPPEVWGAGVILKVTWRCSPGARGTRSKPRRSLIAAGTFAARERA